MGGYVAQRRSIRRLCRLERILRVLPPGNSLLSPDSEEVRKAQEVGGLEQCFYCNDVDNVYSMFCSIAEREWELTARITSNGFPENLQFA